MSRLNQNMSLCHFAPNYMVSAVPDGSVTPGVYCAYCQQLCKPIPRLGLDGTQLELALRRYKDGDADYQDAQDVVFDLAQDAVVALLTEVGRKLYTDYNEKIQSRT
jgi:hypothetical protein